MRLRLEQNLAEVEGRIAAACARAGRKRGDVRLVAVTKSVPAEVAEVLAELGVHDLGESRPQELWKKAAALKTGVRWHLIGHLQRNKIERTLPLVTLVHTVDSLRLLESVEAWAVAADRSVEVLLEVNASEEEAKQGFRVEEMEQLLPILPKLRKVHVTGLMTMAALADDPNEARPTFARLRHLRERLQAALGPGEVRHLSMGMSGDYEVAIEEGATLVRLGTVLFAGI